jgi:hypothetical protein
MAAFKFEIQPTQKLRFIMTRKDLGFYHDPGGSWLSYQDTTNDVITSEIISLTNMDLARRECYQDPLQKEANAISLWNNNLGYQAILE